MNPAENLLARKILRRGSVAQSPLRDTEFVGQTFARNIEEGLRPLVKTITSSTLLHGRVLQLSDALEGVSVPAMLGLLKVEGAPIQGLISLDGDLADHLIDLMLGGDPSAAPVPVARPFTGIDMALCRLPLEALSAALTGALETCFGKAMPNRISIADQRQDITQIRLAPDSVDALVYTIALNIGPAARCGNLQLFLPLAILDVICAALQDETAEIAKDRPSDLWAVQMRRAAAAAPVVVNAVLHRQHLTIAALHALKPGDVLTIPADAPDEIQLVIGQPAGKTALAANGRLGAYGGAKVVKLTTPVDQRIQDHIRRSL